MARARKPVIQKLLVIDPAAVSPMSQAVSVGMTLLKLTKMTSWSTLAERLQADDPAVIVPLMTIVLAPRVTELLDAQRPVLELLRSARVGSGEKSTTVAICPSCGRWLLTVIGAPATAKCPLTLGCTGAPVSVKEAKKVDPAVDVEAVTAPDELDSESADLAQNVQAEADRLGTLEAVAEPYVRLTTDPVDATPSEATIASQSRTPVSPAGLSPAANSGAAPVIAPQQTVEPDWDFEPLVITQLPDTHQIPAIQEAVVSQTEAPDFYASHDSDIPLPDAPDDEYGDESWSQEVPAEPKEPPVMAPRSRGRQAPEFDWDDIS